MEITFKSYSRRELEDLPRKTRNGWDRLAAVEGSQPNQWWMIARRSKQGAGKKWACGCPAFLYQVKSKKKNVGVKGITPGNPELSPCKHIRNLLNKQYSSEQVFVFAEDVVGHLIK